MNDGGPAFPVTSYVNADGATYDSAIRGMSLRDYFAGRCLTAYVHSLEQPVPEGGCSIPSKQLVAQVCYEFADAMIAQRSVRSGVSE